MELVFLVLDNMRLDNQVVSFSALKLVESVFVNCISELTLYVNKAVQQLGFPVGHYIKGNCDRANTRLQDFEDEVVKTMDLEQEDFTVSQFKKFKDEFDVFYYYYPKRLGQVLFVEAPFIFKPIWQVAKPLLRSYTSLVRFCPVETVRKEYFTEETLPASFREKTL
ncbi:hypothetical protein NC652_035061 [Populus alba x Populus x berolinensis]|nr:hypothetical protein NC652_035061 [Populus alba x Populus x berolinensis]